MSPIGRGCAPKRGQATRVVPFNPLAKKVLGAAIAEALLTTPLYAMETRFPRKGPGIYAIYYSGDFPAYDRLSRENKERPGSWPIYVGQALPTGGRRGIEVATEGNDLRDRIGKHLRSIRAAALTPGHFQYRALVMDDAFIRLGETSLLTLYKPIWNTYVDGFGNNTPGAGRKDSQRSRWDTLHGGRAQAQDHRSRDDEPVELIEREIRTELENTNFQLPETLISAADQSEVEQTQMDIEMILSEKEPPTAV